MEPWLHSFFPAADCTRDPLNRGGTANRRCGPQFNPIRFTVPGPTSLKKYLGTVTCIFTCGTADKKRRRNTSRVSVGLQGSNPTIVPLEVTMSMHGTRWGPPDSSTKLPSSWLACCRKLLLTSPAHGHTMVLFISHEALGKVPCSG